MCCLLIGFELLSFLGFRLSLLLHFWLFIIFLNELKSLYLLFSKEIVNFKEEAIKLKKNGQQTYFIY